MYSVVGKIMVDMAVKINGQQCCLYPRSGIVESSAVAEKWIFFKWGSSIK
jgi:hypothetical protein